jgi:hypothetical protein
VVENDGGVDRGAVGEHCPTPIIVRNMRPLGVPQLRVIFKR